MEEREYPDVVKTILARPRNGSGGGIPLTRGEVAMLFLDGYAGDGPDMLDVRSQGYGDDYDWDGLTVEDVIEDENTVFVWEKWEPLELWSKQPRSGPVIVAVGENPRTRDHPNIPSRSDD